MKNTQVIYTETQEIMGYYPRGKDGVYYDGKLIITDKQKDAVTLELKLTRPIIIYEFPEKKKFKGDCVAEVYGKLSDWFSRYGFIFLFPK